MIRGAIFDMDGTLLDSMPFWENAGEIYLASIGVAAKPGLSKVLYPLTVPEAAAYLKKAYSLPQTPTGIEEGINRTVESFYFDKAPAKNGVAEFLEGLRGYGIKKAVATVTGRECAGAALTRLGLMPLFERIVTSDEVGAGKDRPDIYLRAAQVLGTSVKQTLVFEDAVYAARTSARAGFVTVGVYDGSCTVQEELRSVCRYYISGFEDFHAFAAEALL